jgi:hypothetical protein
VTVADLCDGSLEHVAVLTRCSFEMLKVLEAPLLLVQGDLIAAKVRAYNSIGWGEYSPANNQG